MSFLSISLDEIILASGCGPSFDGSIHFLLTNNCLLILVLGRLAFLTSYCYLALRRTSEIPRRNLRFLCRNDRECSFIVARPLAMT